MAVTAVAGLMSAAGAGIAAAAAGTAFTIFGLSGLAAYATAFAIGAGLSMVSRALMPAPSLGQNLAGRSVTVRQPDVTRKIIYGQARVGGAIVYLVSTGPKNEYLHLVMTVAGHEIESFEEMWFNDDKVWDKDTGFADDYGNYVLFNRYLGNQTTVDPDLDAASAQWTSAHVLNGVAYAMVRLKYDVDQFAQGLPNISFVIKGRKVYNPITDVTEWTQNPALCVYDYLLDSRYGLAESPSNINLAALTSAVNLCDQLVAESDNQIRYTLDGVVDSANSRKENIESMLSAMGGSLVYSGGQYFISGSSYVAPTITIDESVMVGSITVSTKKSRRELYNGVKGVFLNAEENYTVADYPAQISSDYAIADGDPVYLDMGLAFTTNQVRAQRLAKLALLKSRQQTTINVPCNLAALKFKAGDNINVSNARIGWTNKPFQILGYTLNASSDGSIIVDVSAIETSAELYDWQSSDEKDYLSAGEVYIYDGKTTVAPASVTATPYTFLAADGTVESGLDVLFPESNDAFVEYYRVEWKTGAEDWQSITNKLTGVQIANLESNVLYDVRVIAVNQLKVDSAPTYTTATTAVDVTAPALPSNLSAAGGLKQIVVTWDNPADTDFKHVQVFAHTSNSIPATPVALVDSESFVLGNLAAGDVRYFWLKSVDFTGNVSAATASISATVAQAATSDIQDEAVTFDKIDVDSIFANTAVINSITSNAIDVATLNANNISSTTSLTVGTGNNVGVISGEDATYRIWAGNQAPASAPFSVDKSGNVILKNIYLSAGGIPLIDQFGFTQEALSQISATTQTEVNTVAKNFVTEDGSQLITLTTNQATTVSLKYVRDGFSAVSTISGNQSYYEVPLNVTLSVKYRKDGGAWNTISQVLTKTALTSPTATQYQVETILNETPTGNRWYSQTVPSKGCINGANDVEYFLSNGFALDANATYDFYLTLDATVDTTGSPDTIDSDISDTSSKTLTVTVTSGSGFYVSNGGGSQGNVVNADTLGGQLPSYYASTSYVGTAISNLVDSSPATLDTLNELAAALGDDPNFATTVSTSIGTKWTQDNTKISNWDTAYGWGNHASAGYLTSYTDTNTTYSAGTGVTLTGTTFSLTDTNAKLNLSGGTLTGDVTFNDNAKAKFGAGSDLQIYHTGSASIVGDFGEGDLLLRGENLKLQNTAGENYLVATNNGATRLYYDNAEKLATTSTGIDVTGTATMDGLTVDGGAGNSLVNLTPSGTYSTVVSFANAASAFDIVSYGSGSALADNFRIRDNGASRLNIAGNGDISFYEDTGTTAKLTWSAAGEDLNFADNVKATFGAGDDLQIYHDGTHSYIKEAGTGNLNILANDLRIRNAAGNEDMIQVNQDGDVKISYDGSTKLATTATGIDVTGRVVATENTDALRLRSSTNGVGVNISFSDHAAGSYAQNGSIRYVHSDSHSYGSGNAFIVESTESNMTFLANGKLMFKEGLYLKPATGTGAGSQIISSDGTFSVPEYIYHQSNTGTYIRYLTDRIITRAGSGAQHDMHSNGNQYFTGKSIFYTGVDINAGNLEINGTTVIDSSRNLTNIGTISSGAITSSGQLTMSGNNLAVFGPNSGWSRSLAIGGNANNSTSTSASIGTTNGNLHIDAAIGAFGTYLNFYDGTNGVYIGNGASGVAAHFNSSGHLALAGDQSDHVSGYALTVGGVGVIDTTRNITAGTISSGAITSTSSVRAAGGNYYGGSAVSVQYRGFGDKPIMTGVNGATYLYAGNSTTVALTLQSGRTVAPILAIGQVNSYVDVIDSSRNLTNIGTISSGAITATASGAVASFNRTDNDAIIELKRSGSIKGYIGANTGGDIKFYNNTAAGTLTISSAGNLGTTGTISSGAITSTGNVTAYSDKRLKENIQTLDGKKVLQMRGVSFTKDGEFGSGVIAQELEKIAPELVQDGEYKSVAYGNLAGYFIEAIKEQQSEIDELKTLVKQLLEK